MRDVEIFGYRQRIIAADAIKEAEKTQGKSEDQEEDKGCLINTDLSGDV